MDYKSDNESSIFGKVTALIIVIIIVGALVWLYTSNTSQSTSSTPPATQNGNSSSLTGNQTAPVSTPTPQTPSPVQPQPQQKSLADIVKEWGKSTASIVCDWSYSNGSLIKEDSATGLLVTLNSIPTVITNKHVVYDSYYGYTNGCIIKFPNDNGFYMYSNNDPKTTGGYYPNQGSLTVDSNGYDVAYISGFTSSWTPLDLINQPLPTISLSNRSRNDSYLCSNAENTGDQMLILGYPVEGSNVVPFSAPANPTVTEGIISGQDGIYYTTSAKVDSGNSGGLAIDETNDCYFGIPTWDESGNFESLGRILPASTFLHY